MKNFLAGLISGAALTVLGFALVNPAALNRSGGTQGGKEGSCTSQQLEHNRQLVRTFFAPERSPQDAYNLMTPDYVQHNEGVKRFGTINGLADREAFRVIDEILTKNRGRPELAVEAGRPKNEMAFKIIANCDYVVAVHRIHAPDPQKVGGFYPVFDYELWRIKDGKFAEHWDSQKIPSPVPDFMRAPLAEAQENALSAAAPTRKN